MRAGICAKYAAAGTSTVYEVMAESRAAIEDLRSVFAHSAAGAGIVIDGGSRTARRFLEGI